MKPTVYIETTIESYLTAWPSPDIIRLSHEIITRDWWANRRAASDLYVSEFVFDEASRGDPVAARERLEILADIPLLSSTIAANELAVRLADILVLPKRARLDASHVAICAANGIEFLLTWNCTHLANGTFTDKIEETCAAAGFKAPRILTPDFLMGIT